MVKSESKCYYLFFSRGALHAGESEAASGRMVVAPPSSAGDREEDGWLLFCAVFALAVALRRTGDCALSRLFGDGLQLALRVLLLLLR